MKLRAALTIALVLPAAVALTGPVVPAYAAATCQGQPATIEGTGAIAGTEGNDVIVATGPEAHIDARAGNDVICFVDGTVTTGLGDDSVVSTATSGLVEVDLFGGNDSYVNAGTEGGTVYVDEVTGLHVDLGLGGGVVWLYPTSTAGTGSVDFGPHGGWLYALGEEEAHVDLVHHTAGVDNLLTVSIAHVENATGTGAKVRMTGDDKRNQLDAYGCNTVIRGGDGRDKLAKVGNGFDLELATCHSFRSTFKGEGGSDRMSGRDGNDVMLGGAGRDVADGSGGNDRCVAEVRRHCER